jgi:hypothetical protein
MAGKRDKPELASSGAAEVIFARHLGKFPQRVLAGNGVKRVSGSAFNA